MTEKEYEKTLYALGATNVTTKRQGDNGTTAYKLPTGQTVTEHKSGYIRRYLYREIQQHNAHPYRADTCYQLNPTYDIPYKSIHDNGLFETTRKERMKIWSRSQRLKRLVLYTIKKLNNG